MSDLLSKTYHTSDMSRISVEGTNHYAVVYSYNCRKLKDSVAGHWSAQWKNMEECIRNICNISVGHEQTIGYCTAEFIMSDASGVNEIKAVKMTGWCYRCRGQHLQHECKNNDNEKFENKPATQQMQKCTCTDKIITKQVTICFQQEHCHSGITTNNVR